MEKIKSSTICVLAWKGLTVSPNSNTYPCCHTMVFSAEGLGNLNQQNIELDYNNANFQKIRSQMLNNERPSICQKCFDEEDKGITSTRQTINNEEIEQIVTIEKEFSTLSSSRKITYLDYRPTNLCNLKCRTCNPSSSSAWYQDAKTLNLNFNNADASLIKGQKIDQMNDLNFADLKEIYFAGGEPMLHSEHYQVLDKLINTNNFDIKLRYSTNLTTLEAFGNNILKLWALFKNITLLVSIDAPSTQSGLIRHNTDANLVYSNLKLIRIFLPHVQIKIATTVSCLNAFLLKNLINELLKNQILQDKSKLELSLVYNPDYYSLNALCENEFKNLADQLKEYSHELVKNHYIDLTEEFSKIIQFKHSYNFHLRQKFYDITLKLDAIRKESSASIIKKNQSHNLFEFICH